jgi:type IV pilus assembly protein PilB
MINLSYSKKLGQMLLEKNLVTAGQLTEALNEQQSTGEKLGRILTKLGYISEIDIVNLLEQQLNIPKVTIPVEVPAKVLELIPEQMMRRHKLFPIKQKTQILTVAMVDPVNVVALDELQQTTKLKIRPVLASEHEIDTAIARHFEVKHYTNELREHQSNYETDSDNEAPIVRMVNTIINQAINDRASDIHIEPQTDGVLVRVRVDGLLRELMLLPLDIRESIISRVKILAQLDISIKMLPQDGRMVYKHPAGDVDLRISTIPTVAGEKVVIRILKKQQELLNIYNLGFSPGNLTLLRKIIFSTHGMILITGPTGSGKTTTLYAILNELKTPAKNIITIEDPVEYTISGVNQIQVNNKTNLTFAIGLRAILRQDPDIIMVGEIRDRETAAVAVRAANTGHLVLSTMHTNDSADALTRLLDMGVEHYLIASGVIGVISQRLVRKLCDHCKQPAAGKLYQAKGCNQCWNTGYLGRIGIHEVMIADKQIRSLINKQISANEIKQVSMENGLIPIKEDGINKAEQALTTMAEVLRVTYSVVD